MIFAHTKFKFFSIFLTISLTDNIFSYNVSFMPFNIM